MIVVFPYRLKPNDVFAPRSHDLNDRTYAVRKLLEDKLERALRGNKYIIIHGESGNGKTWLYKRVFARNNIPFTVINLSKMIVEKSINTLFEHKLGDLGTETQKSLRQEAEGGLKPGGVGVSYKHTYEYEKKSSGPFESLCMKMSIDSRGKQSILVLDNFEQIVEYAEYVRQISSIIVSSDDEFVATTKIKIMIVGTPNNIKSLISGISNANTISNRFVEIPEIARLELAEARYIMQQGFEHHLKYTFLVDKNEFYRDIAFKTDRIAQHIQELCLKIAENAEQCDGKINQSVINQSENDWLEESLSADVAIVEDLMNSIETKVGRKNQVLFCLGRMQKEDFKYSDVEKSVRDTFGVEQKTTLNIQQILTEFSHADNPIIRKIPNKRGYRLCSPKVKMVLRSILKTDDDGKVVRV